LARFAFPAQRAIGTGRGRSRQTAAVSETWSIWSTPPNRGHWDPFVHAWSGYSQPILPRYSQLAVTFRGLN
jgi:hypothetical protein